MPLEDPSNLVFFDSMNFFGDGSACLFIVLKTQYVISGFIFFSFCDRPQCNTADPLKALVFDSTFDHYRGVIANIALFGGEIQKGHKIVSAHTKKRYEVNEVGILTPNEQPTHKL